MATPEMPRDDMVKWLKRLESDLEAVKKKDPFINSGFAIKGPGVVECDNTFNVVGNETVSGTLNVTGNTVIGGTLSLPNGIINNAALSNPISPVTLHADTTNFGPTVAGVTIMSVSATVPSGYTKALLIGMYINASAYNSTAATDELYVTTITTPSSPGWQIPSPSCPAGQWTSAFQQGTLLMNGLTAGSTITIGAQASTSAANWAANAGNRANLDVAILWLR